VGRVGNPERAGRVWGGMKLSRVLFLVFSFVCCMGILLSPSLAHSALWRVMDLICCKLTGRGPAAGFFPLLALLCHISLGDDGFDLLRELNK